MRKQFPPPQCGAIKKQKRTAVFHVHAYTLKYFLFNLKNIIL